MFVLKLSFRWHKAVNTLKIDTLWSNGGILLLNFGQIW